MKNVTLFGFLIAKKTYNVVHSGYLEKCWSLLGTVSATVTHLLRHKKPFLNEHYHWCWTNSDNTILQIRLLLKTY